MSEGFCCVTSTDEPMTPDGFCLAHPNYPAIPPSWGKRGQRFIGGDWQPAIPKPAGYVYKPHFVDTSKASNKPRQPQTYTCQWCGSTFTAVPAGGTPPSYCTSIHKSAALNARRRAAKKAVAS